MRPQTKTAALLVNLGTPDDPSPEAVKRYLKEFLMDPDVVDIPAPLRWLLVHGIILRTRPKSSAALYQSIWTERGSPLRFYHEDLVQGLKGKLGQEIQVVGAMRYGQPSIRDALTQLKAKGIEKLILVPLYPQFSLSATKSTQVHFKRELKLLKWDPQVVELEPFYDRPGFINGFVRLTQNKMQEMGEHWAWDHIIFSFHGLPERQIKKTDATHQHCLQSEDCCSVMNAANKMCYRAQSYQTARKIAQGLGLRPDQWTVGFQSRLGRTPWIQPHSDVLYAEFAKKGLKRLLVLCPSFVADCLETLEEVAIRGDHQFRSLGGEKMVLVPSLNADPEWIKDLGQWISELA